MDLKKLFDPFPPANIHWRVGATNKDKTSGIALAYVDARDVMDRFDDVCGPGNWQAEYPFPGCCRIGLNVLGPDGPQWVWKSNGAGETDFEGTKGQYSDAFKRAAVLWGVGRYLYDLDAPWVEIEPQGRSYKIKQTELRRLYSLLDNIITFAPGEKDELIRQVKDYLSQGDGDAIKEIMLDYPSPEAQMKFWKLFNSQERDAIKELTK